MVEFKDILLKLAVPLKLAGLNLLDNNFQRSRLSFITAICNCFGHLGTWYFVFFVWPNTELIVKSLSVYGFVCQLLVKYLTLISGHKKVQNLLKQVLALHQYHAKGPFERLQPQLWCTKLVNYMFNFTFSLFIATACIFVIIPLLILYFNGQLILPFCFVIPFVDFTTLVGYSFNYVIQCIILYDAVLIECSFDMLMVIFIIHTITFVHHFKMDLDEFAEYMEGKGHKDPKELKKKFKHIHQKHLEIIE